jgi:hypothetical protein
MPTRRLIRRPREAEEYDDAEEPEGARTRLRRQPDQQPERGSRRGDDDGDLRVGTVNKGWGGYHNTKANAPSKFTDYYRVEDDEQVILFLEDAPYASFLMHWADWMPRGKRQSYVCRRPEPCPLCEIEDPQARIRFNILDLKPDPPVHKTFECGITVAEMLDKFTKDNALGGSYFAIQMTGKKQNRRTQLRPVKVRDLDEDWGVTALTKEQFESYDKKLLDESSVTKSTPDELEAVAEEYTK